VDSAVSGQQQADFCTIFEDHQLMVASSWVAGCHKSFSYSDSTGLLMTAAEGGVPDRSLKQGSGSSGVLVCCKTDDK
jgi:hypothetical protein